MLIPSEEKVSAVVDPLYRIDFPARPVFATGTLAVLAAMWWQTGDFTAAALGALLVGWIAGIGLGLIVMAGLVALTGLATLAELLLAVLRAIEHMLRRASASSG